MPNIKSAKKRVKVIQVKTLRNQIIKSALKTAIKRFELTAATGDKSKADVAFRLAVKKIDMATAKGVMHKNTASRRKSKLAVALNGVGA